MKDGGFSDILSDISKDTAVVLYGLNADDVESCVVAASTYATPEDYAQFKTPDAAAAARVFDAVKSRIELQKGVYAVYGPGELPKLDNAIAKQSGQYVVYVCTADTKTAEAILSDYGL
jgi:hypothetical protein